MLDLIPELLQGVLSILALQYAGFWAYVIVAVLVDRRRRLAS